MSRIGKLPIPVPQGVEINSAADGTLTIKGPKGHPRATTAPGHEDRNARMAFCRVIRPTDEDRHRALHGLTRTLVSNMVTGVSTGYRKVLEIEGVGYRAAKEGNKLVMSLGFSHQVNVDPLPGIELEAGVDVGRRTSSLPSMVSTRRRSASRLPLSASFVRRSPIRARESDTPARSFAARQVRRARPAARAARSK